MQYAFVILHDDGEFACLYTGLVDNTRGLELKGGRWTLNGGKLPTRGHRMVVTLEYREFEEFGTVTAVPVAQWEATLEKYTLDEATGVTMRFLNQKRVK